MVEPKIIQAGMGIGVSDWVLANSVAKTGHMGVVSGTALDSVLIRRLQLGDIGGHNRRALDHFPLKEAGERIYNKYFVAGGKAATAAFAGTPMLSAKMNREHQELLIAANFIEVWLAKENHSGKIGINYLEKIQMPLLPSLYGAMLAGVDYVLMGAGIPRELPALIDNLTEHKDVEYKLHVAGSDEKVTTTFSPNDVLPGSKPEIKRPKFLAIISSTVLAITLAKRIARPVDGFVIEAPSAGGHNAPPRLKDNFNERGEPIYGPKDAPDLKAIGELGLPFWLAGSRGSAEGLQDALDKGAAGIQVGTAFALCDESGLTADLKRTILQNAINGKIDVYTDPVASPTGFPFKVFRLENSNSQQPEYEARTRVCDLGYLRELYRSKEGKIGYRCASEPVKTYLAKDGELSETAGRKCLCNALLANIGMPQTRSGGAIERPIITLGDDVESALRFIKGGVPSYTAADVIAGLMSPASASATRLGSSGSRANSPEAQL